MVVKESTRKDTKKLYDKYFIYKKVIVVERFRNHIKYKSPNIQSYRHISYLNFDKFNQFFPLLYWVKSDFLKKVY